MISTLNHQFFVDIDNQLISEHFCAFLGINISDIPKLLNSVPTRQTCKSIFAPREMYYFTMPQAYELLAKAPSRQFSDKLIKVINEKVIPLFNPIVTQTELLPEANKPETMSSLEIAQLTGKRHADVIRDIKNMLEQLNIDERNFASIYLDAYKREKPCYNLNEELTLTLTSGYSIPQRHAIIREWQAHRHGGLTDYQPQIISPTTPHTQIERPQTSKPHNASFLQTTLKQIDSMQLSAESRQVLKAHLLHKQAGLPLELMLPVIRDEKLSPAQIALRMNVSPQAVGHIISKLGIRGNQNYSEARLSHSERSKKDVVVHFYNNQAVNMIQQALKDKQNEKKN
jgi:hypothetical protein